MSSKERKMIYEAVSLAERFPDLPDRDVLEHIEYVCRTTIAEGAVIEYAILRAYDTQNENVGLDYIKLGE